MVNVKLLTQVVKELRERGFEAWSVHKDKMIIIGVDQRGTVSIPVEKFLEEGPEKVAEAIARWANGTIPFLGYGINAVRGDGEFPFELFTQREAQWLEFQSWLVDMGYYLDDMVPEGDRKGEGQ